MKKLVILTVMVVLAATTWAEGTKGENLSLGYKLEEINNNFGLHLDVVSPKIFKFFNVRASGGFVADHMDFDDYHNSFLLGVRGSGGAVSDVISLYGEAGLITIKDSDEYLFGGYGLFGFEFFTSENFKSPVSYFIELGTNNCSDDLYSGFTTNVGVRYYF